jgi:hypothetical protein
VGCGTFCTTTESPSRWAILGAEQLLTGEVQMDDQKKPDDLSWNWQRQPVFRPFSRRPPGGLRVPRPPGPPRKPSRAEREQEKRAEARAKRLHLAGLTNAGAVVMTVVLVAVVVMLVLVLVSHH